MASNRLRVSFAACWMKAGYVLVSWLGLLDESRLGIGVPVWLAG